MVDCILVDLYIIFFIGFFLFWWDYILLILVNGFILVVLGGFGFISGLFLFYFIFNGGIGFISILIIIVVDVLNFFLIVMGNFEVGFFIVLDIFIFVINFGFDGNVNVSFNVLVIILLFGLGIMGSIDIFGI